MSALLKAGFPTPWKELNDDARSELIRVIGEWDEERKKSYPPLVIDEAVIERDLQRELASPIWRFIYRVGLPGSDNDPATVRLKMLRHGP